MKRKTPEGQKVSFPLSNEKVFLKSSFTTNVWNPSGKTTQAFKDWMTEFCGPPGILWKAERSKDRMTLDIYFLLPKQAMLAKLTWM